MRACVRAYVCLWGGILFVNSEFSRTGRRSAAPFSPTWRDSSGELHRLHLESTERVPRERKTLELFRCQRVKPRPSRYIGAILKNGSSS